MLKTDKNLPGIIQGLENFPGTGRILRELAHSLLVPSYETKFDRIGREIVATYISILNDCEFCANSHGAVVVKLSRDKKILDELIALVKTGKASHPLLSGMLPVIDLAHAVHGSSTNTEHFDKLRNDCYSEEDIHAIILTASAFNMFNRYVSGMRSPSMAEVIGDYEPYITMAQRIVERGYSGIQRQENG